MEQKKDAELLEGFKMCLTGFVSATIICVKMLSGQ